MKLTMSRCEPAPPYEVPRMNVWLSVALHCTYSMPRPLPQLLGGREPGVLLYHGTPRRTMADGKYHFDRSALEQQVVCLKKHFDMIRPEELHAPRSSWSRKAVLLTFDDGFQNNAREAVPVLAKHGVPAIFFVCTGHLQSGRVLWFAYLSALEHAFAAPGFSLRGEYYDMSPECRQQSMTKLRNFLLGLRPHPQAMYRAIADELPLLESFMSQDDVQEWCSCMTAEEMAELDAHELFSVEAHTSDHPFLTMCSPEEARRQVLDNKQVIERVCGKTVTAISYPSGDYNRSILMMCRDLGFLSGHAVNPRVGCDTDLEVPRAGIYQPYKEVAAFKAMWSRRRVNRG